MAEKDNRIPEDDIANLYRDVVSRLETGRRLDFDSEDLIDVYDYATDISDGWVSGEIMNSLLQSDPDFEPMLERKAMRLLMAEESVGAAAVASRLGEESFIRHLVFSWLTWDAAKWQQSYSALLNVCKPKMLYDYETTALVTLALTIDDIRHLASLIDKVKPFCAYPDTFVATVAETLRDEGYIEESLPLFIELTEMDAFSVEYWVSLGDLYINRLNNIEEGEIALDYALALNPDCQEALKLYGDLLLKTDAPAEKIHALADRLTQAGLFPEGPALKASAFMKEGKFNEASDLMLDIAVASKTSLSTYLMLLQVEISPAQRQTVLEALKNYVAAASDEEMLNWFYETAITDGSSTVFDVSPLVEEIVSSGKGMSDDLFSIVLARLFICENYRMAVDIYERRINSGLKVSFDDTVVYVLGNLALGRMPERMAELYSKAFKEFRPINKVISTNDISYFVGLRNLETVVREQASYLIERSKGNQK